MIIDQAQPYRNEVIALLSAEKLPAADLPETLEHFIVAIQDAKVIGVAGLEVYDEFGLLRSVAVSDSHRGKSIAAKLLRRIEALASLKNIAELFLLTETAAGYFERKTYRRISREEVPEPIKASSEFSHVCPVSAVVMSKPLKPS